MATIHDFYMKVLQDEEAKQEFTRILGGKKIEDIGDTELLALGKLAERMGFHFTLEEGRSYFSAKEGKLSEDALDSVAGGKKKYLDIEVIRCEVGGDAQPSNK